MPNLYIDSREPERWKKLVETIAAKEGFTPIVMPLTYGDYMTEHAIVERKSIFDLMSSVLDKRYEKQEEGLTLKAETENKIPFLLVHGSIREAYESRKQFGTPDPMLAFGAISSMAARSGFQLLWVTDDYEAAVVMVKILKKIEEGKWLVPRKRNTLILAARLLGVNIRQMEALMDKYGSLVEVGLATKSGLQEVHGIGPAKADTIKRVLNSDLRTYEKEEKKRKLTQKRLGRR